MRLNKYRLGDFIERSTANNRSLKYKEDLIVGVTSDGVFSTPKGNVNGVDLTPYKIVSNGDFVYNPSRFDLGSIAYRTEGLCIVSHLYQIFHLNEKGKEKIDPIWLFIYLRRKEFRREVTFRNFGSQRPEFNFNDLSEIVLPLPSIEQQRKYVDVYLALQNNLAVYQSKVDELKLVCDGYFDKAKKGNVISLGELIERVDKRNADGFLKEDSVRGITNKKQFDNTKADLIGTDLSKFLVIDKGVFAYNSRTDGRDMLVLALNEEEHSVIVTWNYNAFRIKDEYKTLVNPEYLYSFFLRSEFDRRVRFNSWGSSQELLSWDNFCDIKVPFPDINEQDSISKMSHVFLERKAIVEQLKEQLNGLCPVLIRGSLEKEV